jgi:GT2 family glycosyltransferase
VEVPTGSSPAAARNAAIAASRSPLCLLCDDDVRPAPGMIGAHVAFHAAEPDPMVALMGLVVPEPPLDRSEFQRWLHTGGIQFGYGSLRAGPIAGRHLWVANASFKRDGLATIGGFDEAIGFGSEDADLGSRFVAAGGRIIYRDNVVGLHFRPTTLPETLARMRRVGAASREHPDRLAAATRPRPTGLRHRVTLALLTAADRAGLLHGPLRRAAWRALCKQAYRESYWEESLAGIQVGARLADRLERSMEQTDPSAG